MALPATSPLAEDLTIYDVTSEEIRVLPARRRMPARALAPIIGKSQQMVSQRMTGISKWTLDDLDAIARYFGVDANTLLPGPGKQGVGGVRPLGLEPRTRCMGSDLR